MNVILEKLAVLEETVFPVYNKIFMKVLRDHTVWTIPPTTKCVGQSILYLCGLCLKENGIHKKTTMVKLV